ncbi:unnamed protein product [Urochloa humidicola]
MWKGGAPWRAAVVPMAKIGCVVVVLQMMLDVVRSEEAPDVLEVDDGDGLGRWPCCPAGRRPWRRKKAVVPTAEAKSRTMPNFLVPVDTMRKNDFNYKQITSARRQQG